MDSEQIIKTALSLSPQERLLIIDTLSKSLSEPNKKIEALWKEEAESRYKAFIEGKITSIPYEQVLKNES
jgi:putative addiction module component (TIGR02574 family)